MEYEKKYVTLPEAVGLYQHEIDWFMEAASEGVFRVFVISKGWPAKTERSSATRPISGYVELLPEALVESRNSIEVTVRRAKLASGEIVTFESPQSVGVGGVYVPREALEPFKVARAESVAPPATATSGAEPGPKAVSNLERTIGLLAHFIAHKMDKSRYLRGSDAGAAKVPNAKQLAEDLAAHLKTHGLSKKYLSESAVQKRIIDGLASLKPKDDDE